MTATFVAAGAGVAERERRWAREMGSTLRELLGAAQVIGMERLNAGATLALAAEGFRLVDAQEPIEVARSVKCSAEVVCIRAALSATEVAAERMRRALRPGMTENELWSLLHQSVIAQGGEHCETRLLASGAKTNPWFQETDAKNIGSNELVAFDTDVVGCHGYYCDFSRTFHSGPDKPSLVQRSLYGAAYDQVQHNLGLLKPGLSFREYSDLAWQIPENYVANRYYVSAHGCGMTGSTPTFFIASTMHRRVTLRAGNDPMCRKLYWRGIWGSRSEARGAMSDYAEWSRASIQVPLRADVITACVTYE